MKDLASYMDPEEYKKFTEQGFFTSRRTNKFYAGVFSDQTIEQTLMRSMKVAGGPFKRGASDSVVWRWIKGTTYTRDIIEGIENFCRISFRNHQHVDASDARVQRDATDVKKLKDFFEQHNPFPTNTKIMCISSGILGNDSIDCHNAFERGCATMKNINGKNFKELSFTKKDKVTTLLSLSSKIKLNNKIISIDPLLIFQRISVIKTSNEEFQSYFNYELSPLPLALFDDHGQMRKTQKASLYDLFNVSSKNILDVHSCTYIIDGGMLLHRVNWGSNVTFNAIYAMFLRYLRRNYPNCRVVFDGYQKETTKSVERIRRSEKISSPDCEFQNESINNIVQEPFLANTFNKSRLIDKLSEYLAENEILCFKDDGDADRLIVETAINVAINSYNKKVVIVSEDVDVMVLLTALTPASKEIFLLKPSRSKAPAQLFSSKSFQETYPNCKPHILFLHSFTGSDTTSCFFNKGKKLCKTFGK